MPFIGSVSGSSGFGRGTLAGAPSWITAAGSIGTLNDNQRGNTLSVQASPGPGAVSVTYSVVGGSLPTGASLNGSTGVISGFGPVSSNTTSSFTVRATNNAGLTADQTFSITINAVTITFNSPAAGAFAGQNINTSFSRTYSATVSSGTVTYARVSGTIPSGTSINSSTGAHTGTLSSGGSFSWTVRATGTSGAASVTVDRAFSITVARGPVALSNTMTTPDNLWAVNDTVTFGQGTGSTSFPVRNGRRFRIVLRGASGGRISQPGTVGGANNGNLLDCTVDLSAYRNTTLTFVRGGGGQGSAGNIDGSTGRPFTGGSNGGGQGGGTRGPGGGGRTDLRITSSATSELMVAGGGGGDRNTLGTTGTRVNGRQGTAGFTGSYPFDNSGGGGGYFGGDASSSDDGSNAGSGSNFVASGINVTTHTNTRTSGLNGGNGGNGRFNFTVITIT